MRLSALLFTAILTATPVRGQQAQPSSTPETTSAGQDVAGTGTATKDQEPKDQEPKDQGPKLPVSVEKIREALELTAPALSLRTLDERPTFRVLIQERMKIEELLATLNFKTSPAPGGGLYGFEQQRQMFNAVDRPLQQPYAAFNQTQLLTILIENLMGTYLGGRVMSAISNAERARAEANAREDVRAAVEQYCNAQPNAGAGIQICSSLGR